ncbi:MAG: TolC family protein, partial [Taibaiella sp.]|nr:TolC family protein [Taibaiella sp.]
MYNRNIKQYIWVACISLTLGACNIPSLVKHTADKTIPAGYINNSQDTANTAKINWKEYFNDQYLDALIDTALQRNQELNIVLQEIDISRNEIRVRKGEYLPFVGIKGGAGVDKVGRYTNIGAMEANTEIEPGREMPEPVPDYMISAYATWEIDIWRKLRNAKKAAVARYLATVEGKNFVVTNLVAEIANSYYELLALDNQLDIVNKNIEIQNNALEIVKLQKEATRVTELAVRRFEAQALYTRSLQYGIQQKIVETENRINFLLGRYPQPIARSKGDLGKLTPAAVNSGIPAQ